jgi:hypothetical protein
MKKENTVYTKIPIKLKEGFVPRTALVKKLLSLRNISIASGMKLLCEDEILDEVKRRRGESVKKVHKTRMPHS